MSLISALVSTDEELSSQEQKEQGFVTWLYSLDLLKQLHKLAPSIIVKDNNRVTGYALTTLRESRTFHPDLDNMVQSIDPLIYKGKPLVEYSYYCMGQICIDKNYFRIAEA